jgi:hypothetical protein
VGTSACSRDLNKKCVGSGEHGLMSKIWLFTGIIDVLSSYCLLLNGHSDHDHNGRLSFPGVSFGRPQFIKWSREFGCARDMIWGKVPSLSQAQAKGSSVRFRGSSEIFTGGF